MTWNEYLSPADLDFFRQARTGHLATLGAGGFPSVIPICFALLDSSEPTIVSVLDEKPKTVPDRQLGRVRNIARHPQVGFTVDHYDEDWTKLVSIQIRGVARLVPLDAALHAASLAALREKYPQYRLMDLDRRLVIAIDVVRVRTWRASPPPSSSFP